MLKALKIGRDKHRSEKHIPIDKFSRARFHHEFTTAHSLARKHKGTLPGALVLCEEHIYYNRKNTEQKNPVAPEKLTPALTILKDHPSDLQARVLYGQIKLFQKDVETALTVLQNVPTEALANPTDIIEIKYHIQGLYYLARCQEAKKDLAKEATNTYTKAFNLALEYGQKYGEDVLIFEKEFLQKAALRLGLHSLSQENWADAIEWFRQAITSDTEASASAASSSSHSNSNTTTPNSPSSTALKAMHKLVTALISCPERKYTPIPEEHGSRVFTPRDATEEALLCLMILQEYGQVSADLTIYDDMALTFSKTQHYNGLINCYTGLLSTELFGVNKYWYQFALALYAEGRYRDCLVVIDQFIKRNPMPELSLLAVQICLSSLNTEDLNRALSYMEGVEFGEDLKFQQNHIAATAYAKLAFVTEKPEYTEKCFEYLHNAYKLDPADYRVCYDLAFQFSQIRDIKTSLKYVKEALLLNRGFAPSWALFSLLLTAQKQDNQALAMIKLGIQESPSNLTLLVIRAQLEQHLEQYEQGMHTYLEAVELWRELEKSKTSLWGDSSSLESSLLQDDTSHRDSRALFTQNASPVVGPTNPIDEKDEKYVQGVKKSQLWLLFAQIFTKLKQFDDALNCIREAQPGSHTSAITYYQEGLVYEGKGDIEKALLCYEKALSLREGHAEAALRSGILYLQQEKVILAENSLMTAAQRDKKNHECWFYLGQVYLQKEEYQKAAECFTTSIELQKTAPVIPFSKFLRMSLDL